MKAWTIPLLAAALITAAAADRALAITDPVQTVDGIQYACTGVGMDSRDDPRWSEFSTKLVFAAQNGGYLGDVAVTVEDGEGRQVFSAECLAPWMLVDLPSGRYQLRAVARDSYDQQMTLSVDEGRQTTRILRFPRIAD
jgi:hypothetical protein